MAKIIKLKKGLDIPLAGESSSELSIDTVTGRFAVIPDDYPGYKWKLDVKVGDIVMAGSPIMHDKETGKIFLTSPVSGKVAEIRRGERRKLIAVVIEQEGHNYKMFSTGITPEENKKLLLDSGIWAMLRQLPYAVIPDPDVIPRDIFVTVFDSAPLARDILMPDQYAALEKGLHFLSTLTKGKVYLGVPFGSGISSTIAEVIEFQGPHPAGNPSIQAANISPVNKGETIWILDARTVSRIGVLVTENHIDTTTIVTVCGEYVTNPHQVSTYCGAELKTMLNGFISQESGKARVISGNVLSGIKCDVNNDFLRYPYRQVTIIPEGDDTDEFMGWASLSPRKYSVKRTFPAYFLGRHKKFNFDARIKGGHRAMILSGEYDKVFPMDIYPEYLLRAIIAKDIEKMENLGIYEVTPEDFALAEFVDTSKIPLQKIVRDSLDYLRSETN